MFGNLFPNSPSEFSAKFDLAHGVMVLPCGACRFACVERPVGADSDTTPHRHASTTMLRRPSFSLLTVVAVLMSVPVIAVGALVVYFAGVATRSVAERHGTSLLVQNALSASAELEMFLGRVERQSDFALAKYDRGRLSVDDPFEGWPKVIQQLDAFPAVRETHYVTTDGVLAGATRRPGHDDITLLQVRDGIATEFALDETQSGPGEVIATYEFDPRATPWFIAAMEAATPHWTQPYLSRHERARPTDLGSDEVLLAYTRLVHRRDESIAGVMVSKVSLTELGQHLARHPSAGGSDILVVDRDGSIVCSTFAPLLNSAGERVRLDQLLGGINPSITDLEARSRTAQASERSVILALNGHRRLGFTTPCGQSRGLDWTLISAVPSITFYGTASTVQRQMLLISASVLLLSVLLAVRLGRGLTRPILRLREHVHALGEGDFDHRMVIESMREMEDLNGDLNRMAGQLRERVVLRQAIDLATEVQQSLLPRPVLRRKGLDLCGQSQYCDATGGDYYDFLEVVSTERTSTLVAVGDVMGHGVAAALLMASARAALRAQALQSESLASMMDIVNRVLAQSRGRSWFMTMFLLMIDPERRNIRWASAGHTLALVHDPETGETRDLEGGDLPLGIDGGVHYEEYSEDDLPPNAVILLGTDGIWETVNEAGEPFGMEPVRRILTRFGDRGAEEIASRLRDAVASYRGDVRADDDVTFVVVRLTAERIELGTPDGQPGRTALTRHIWPEPSPDLIRRPALRAEPESE